MEATLKRDRHDAPVHFVRTESGENASVSLPSRAWVKSVRPPSVPGDLWDRDSRGQDPRNASAPGAVENLATLIGTGHDGRREVHRPTPLERDRRVGMFLAGTLLAVLAWGALGTPPRGAAVVVAMFAGAFMAAAVIGTPGRWRNPGSCRFIDIAPARSSGPAGAALPGARPFHHAGDAAGTVCPADSANGGPPELGASPEPRRRSGYDGVIDG